MKLRQLLHRTPRIGVALGYDRLVAMLPTENGGAPWIRPLAPSTEPGVVSPELADALRALRVAMRPGDRRANESQESVASAPVLGVLHVALLPPLAQNRRLELPGLRLEEARQVVRREPSRYLPIGASTPVAVEIEGTGWRESSPFTVLAASRALVDGIHAAARQSGWHVAEIVSAQAAWAASAEALSFGDGDSDETLVVCTERRIEVVRARGGRLVGLRRIPSALSETPALLARTLEIGARSEARRRPPIPIGDSADAENMRATWRAHGVVLPSPDSRALPPESPAALAARFAPIAAGPTLMDDAERAAQRRRRSRLSVAGFAAAGKLVALAAVIQLWGFSRERASIKAERERLREPVARALATRDSLAAASQRLTTIRAAAAGAPRWSALIASISAELPDDGYLLSLRADADTLRLEGSAARAALVFDALARVPGVASIRPEGPIRQELGTGRSPSERYTLSASLGRTR